MLKGKSIQGELPIRAQSNPLSITGYFANGESHRSVSIDSLSTKGTNMTSGQGKKPTPPKKPAKSSAKPNPPAKSEGVQAAMKQAMQQIQNQVKGKDKGTSEALVATRRLLERTNALAGKDPKKAKEEVKKFTSSLQQIFKKSQTTAAQAKPSPKQDALHKNPASVTGDRTGHKDVDGLVLKVGDRVIRSDDERYRNRYGSVLGVSKTNLLKVAWDDGTYTNHSSEKSLRRAAPYKPNPDSAWGEMFKQLGAGVGSFSLAGMLHAGLRALFDKFAPQMVQKYEGVVDTGIGLVSIGGTGAIALHPKLQHLRPGFWSFLALRLVNHVGRHLPKQLPPAIPKLLGAAPTSTLDGLIDLESGEMGGTEVVVDVWDPSDHLPTHPPRNVMQHTLAPQDWERRALR
ncbi:MAG: hypothetical protein H6727_09370 [Myxococcales bacterium]|nr:hypothetical protein [Myxococcales bacterium]